MIVAVACDHGGFPLKEDALEAVRAAGHEPLDLGTYSAEKVDYPDFAARLAYTITSGRAERGVLLCGSGVGACVAANKIPGIYASVCHDTYSAHQGVEHDAMNVLCIGARIVGPALAQELIKAFLSAEFYNSGNYLRRFNKVKQLEAGERLE